jgi:hypothetical protein
MKAIIHSVVKAFLIGIGFGLGLMATIAIGVTVSTTFNSGDTLTANSLNALKTAIESIPGWEEGNSVGDAVYTGGNVGIGTTNPEEALHVEGSIKTSSLEGSGQRCVAVDTNGVLISKTSDCGTLSSGDDLGNHTASQNFQSNGYWLSNDGGNDGIMIDNSGNIGIGISSPTNKLEVDGDIQVSTGNDVCIDSGTCLSTAGSGSGAFTDTGSLAYYTGGNVGIGTSTPDEELVVSGNIKTTSLAGSGQRCVAVGSTGTLIAKTSDCATSSGGDDLGNHTASSNIQLNGNWLSNDGGNEGIAVTDTGNVGIGTTSPVGMLHVKHGASGVTSGQNPVNDGLILEDDDYAYLTLNSPVGGALWFSDEREQQGGIFYAHSGDYMYFQTSVAERVRITSTGNVGIGTTSPTEKLEVSGTVKATAFEGDGSALTGISGSGAFTDTGSLAYYNSGNVGIGTTSPNLPLHVSSSQIWQAKFQYGSGTYTAINANQLAAFTSGGDASVLYLNDIHAGNVLIATGGGNVGIGTTSPTEKLEVSGTVKATAFEGDGSALTGISGSGAFTDTGSLAYYNSGKVGIGTTSPTGKLTINDGYSIHNANAGSIKIQNDVDSTRMLYMGLTDEYGTYGSAYITASKSGTAYIPLLISAGNVGIGTSTPTEKLEVSGTVKATAFEGDGSALTGISGSGAFTDTGSLAYYTGGNVGIGTTSPGENLVVYENHSIGGPAIHAKNPGVGYAYAMYQNSDSYLYIGKERNTGNGIMNSSIGNAAIINNVGANPIQFGTNNTARAIIDSSGNVGIGTTTPSYKLHVNGTIGTTNSGQVHSDYVFEPGYKLKKLEELEEFIIKEKHLPGIITDPKQSPNVDILALNGKFLEKIEELTLYTIAQEKKINVQQKLNEGLEARLSKLEALLISKK